MNLDLIPKLKHTHSNNFFLLAGPCAIEGEDMAMRIAEKIMTVADSLEIPFILRAVLKKQTEVELIVLQELAIKKH